MMNTTTNTGAGAIRSRSLRLSVALLVAISLTGLGATAAGAAKPERPFKAVVTGTIERTGDTTFTLTGEAVSPGLGRMDYHGLVEITGIDENGVITDVLTETFTTAKGDRLVILCQQVATPIGTNVFLGDDDWTVIGGTGGLSGATGSGTGWTHVDLNALTFSKVLVGTLGRNG